MKPSERLRSMNANHIITAIEHYEYTLWDMDRLHDEMWSAGNLEDAMNTVLDDLLAACMEIAFLEGMKFQNKAEQFLNMKCE